jgi:hypothetical protein
MSLEKETQDFMKKFLDDTVNSLKENGTPLLKQLIDSHKAILSCYRENLDDLLEQDPSTQAEIRMTTMFFEMYVKMMQLQRESRKRVLTIQSQMMNNYLSLLDEMLKKFDTEQKDDDRDEARTEK